MSQRSEDNGGWIPVVKRKRGEERRGMGYKGKAARGSNTLVTLFVDYIPEESDVKELWRLFSSYGVVRDVYIPPGRRSRHGTRFGFVKYDCIVSAKVAIQKANGLWVRNRSIKVKMADYDRQKKPINKSGAGPSLKDYLGNQETEVANAQRNRARLEVGLGIAKYGSSKLSFAEVVKGGDKEGKPKAVVMVQEDDVEWLSRSLVARLGLSRAASSIQ